MSRDVEVDDLADLLEEVPRACLAYTAADGPQLAPVDVERADGTYRVRVPPGPWGAPPEGAEVVLLVDDGVHWFDLRAIYVRGAVDLVPAGSGERSGTTELVLAPRRELAWDYGALREVPDVP